jgi:acetyl-CoA acetyltransferase
LLVHTAAARSGPRALDMADAKVSDVSQCQIYDCYTYTVIATLEDYGFCEKGEGGHLSPMAALARVVLYQLIPAAVSCRPSICGV